jgi:hypothetical protein
MSDRSHIFCAWSRLHVQAEAVRLLDTQLSKSAEAVRKEQLSGG